MGKQKKGGKSKGGSGGGGAFKKSQYTQGELGELHRIAQDAGFQHLSKLDQLKDWCARTNCDVNAASFYLTSERGSIETMATGGCVWWALQIVCAPDPPSMPELNAQINPTLLELQEEDKSWLRSDTGVEDVGWSIPVVVRTLTVKYGADRFTWKQVSPKEIRKPNGGMFFVWGVLNKNYCPVFKGWINEGETDNHWLHAIAVDATDTKADRGRVLCQNMKHLTKAQQEEPLFVSDLLGLRGSMPYFTDLRDVYSFNLIKKCKK